MIKGTIFFVFWILLTIAIRMGDIVAMGLAIIGFLVLFTLAEELEEREK
jgi:hypothetical protein